MRIKALLVLLLLCSKICAQDISRDARQIRYFNSFLCGGLFGEKDKGTAFTFSTIHGIVHNSFRAGAGVGYDSYQRWRTMPLFGIISYDLVRAKENRLYLMATAGYSFSWYRQQQEYEPQYDHGEGVMVNPMIGYRISATKWSINISAGYKWQRLNYTMTPLYYYYDYTLQTPVFSVEETMKRLVFQIGFGLN
jgi:hypothetical protein